MAFFFLRNRFLPIAHLPKIPAWEGDLRMGLDQTPPVPGGSLGKEEQKLLHPNTSNKKNREEQCWKYAK